MFVQIARGDMVYKWAGTLDEWMCVTCSIDGLQSPSVVWRHKCPQALLMLSRSVEVAYHNPRLQVIPEVTRN